MKRETWLIDIGNTHATGARLTASGWETPWQKPTADFLETGNLPGVKVNDFLVVSSVVPSADAALSRTYAHSHFVTPDNLPDLKLNLERPDQVGSDRIVNALAAYSLAKRDVLVVDCGTALTWCYVDTAGTYQGGAIFPGTFLCTQSLEDHTAKVGHISFSFVKDPFGKTTETAVRAGISQLFVHGLRGVIAGFRDYIPGITVFGTGSGLLPFWNHLTLDRYEPQLIFHGLSHCARRLAGNTTV